MAQFSQKARGALRSIKLIRDLYSYFVRWRGKIEFDFGKRLWAPYKILNAEETNERIAELISNRKAFSVGKIGANEQNLMFWAKDVKIPTGFAGYKRRIRFDQTSNCAKNAGLVPWNVDSYREVAELIDKAVSEISLLGIWYYSGEYAYLEKANYLGIDKCHSFHLEPFFLDDPWTKRMAGRRVLLVSPFTESAKKQKPLLNKIWPNGLMPDFELVTYQFPYLFSDLEGARLSWQAALEAFNAFAASTEFDIAIIGVGGLSLPIAEICRSMGRQAIHLGGGAQLLFGIRASRYEADPKYLAFMNEHWVRPAREEVPPEAASIEDGCYW